VVVVVVKIEVVVEVVVEIVVKIEVVVVVEVVVEVAVGVEKYGMTRYGNWNAVGRALTEETDRIGAPYYQKAIEAKQRMNTNTIEKYVEEFERGGWHITDIDKSKKFIADVRTTLTAVAEEAYKKGYSDGRSANDDAEPFYTKDNDGVIHLTPPNSA
jgi:hypothetical protein